jgi:hypothetical protein
MSRADDQPKTYFEIQRRRDRHPEPGAEGGKISDPVPKLPPESPWTTQLPDEPLIDRTEDKS